MPLAFSSLSHGTVPFGFFNIETHMLLLDQLFFFGDRFCEAATTVVVPGPGRAELESWRIVDPREAGNLHGAIAGVDLSGFIGATYAAWPFPTRRDHFRQAPDGERNEARVREMVRRHGTPESIALERADGGVCIGEYRFSDAGFRQLLAYVVRGGYPRWKADRRPAYVDRLVAALDEAGVTIAADAEL